MKHFSLNIFLSFLISISIFAQNDIENKTDNDISVIPKKESINAVNDKIEFKNSPTTSILTITDEGNNASSLTLPDVTSTLSGNKLYNNGGNLYWGADQLGTAVSGGGWTSTTGKIYNTTLSDRIGIGTNTPLSVLHLRTQDNWLPSVGDGWGDFSISDGTKGLAIGMAEFGGGAGDIRIWAKGGTERIMIGDATNGDVLTTMEGKVGVGTTNPQSLLSVGGDGNSNVAVSVETAIDGIGIYGNATNSGEVSNYGGYFQAWGGNGCGIYATGTNNGDGTNYGGFFNAGGSYGRGVYGTAINAGNYTNYGGYFSASGYYGRGVYGAAINSGNYTNYGGYFSANGYYGRGVAGNASGASGYGVYGSAPSTGYAGYFSGRLHATGAITGASKSFKIDHPLDPENKYLLHTSVESPDMMNVYNGNVILDGNGEAIVEMADWFEALNEDFRYQLTAVGAPGPNLYIADKINGNKFRIAGGTPGMEVSWQVTGIRHDAWANDNRTVVEQNKLDNERGKYLHPEAFNLPETSSVDYDEKMKEEQQRIQAEREK